MSLLDSIQQKLELTTNFDLLTFIACDLLISKFMTLLKSVLSKKVNTRYI